MKPIYTKNRVIGLLGGSFNPAHGGHVHISRYALTKLGCDAVWWLVSPQNPLKSATGLVPYEQRLAQANAVAKPAGIVVSDIERVLGTRYTVDTVKKLQQRFPGTRFIWLMGADNLAQFHRWRRWREVFSLLPVVVFDRVPYSHTSQRSMAYLSLRPFLLKNNDMIGACHAPALMFVHLKLNPLSSTNLRKRLEKQTG